MPLPVKRYQYTRGALAVDITISYDRWTDPGDYPSGAGGGPLPPGPWVPDTVEGFCIYTLTQEEQERLGDGAAQRVDAFVEDVSPTFEDVTVAVWTVIQFSGAKLVFVPKEWAAIEGCCALPEPEYDLEPDYEDPGLYELEDFEDE